MKNLKRMLALIMSLTLLGGIVGCTKEGKEPGETEPLTREDTTATETVLETETETESRTEAETDAPVSPEEARLNELLANKTKLHFDENGEFRVMVVSDLHMNNGGMDVSDLKVFKKMVAKEDPDLIIFNGDNVVDSNVKTISNFRITLKALTDFLERDNRYWMLVYGNHDGEIGISKEEQQAHYESYDHCLAKAGDAEVAGVGNYVIPVYGSTPETADVVKFAVWGIDSGDYLTADEKATLFPTGTNIFPDYGGTDYDYIRHSQIQWYIEASDLLKANNGGEPVYGMMAFHIPLQETYLAWVNRDGLEWTGVKKEPVAASGFNSGLYEVLRARGDVKMIVNGHDHINDFMVNYGGIKLCYSSKITTVYYHDLDILGVRMCVINESDPADVQTYMSYVKNLE